MNINKPIRFLLFILLLTLTACNMPFGNNEDDNGDWETSSPTANENETTLPPQAPIPEYSAGDKWSLWVGTTQLRGVNIYQRVVIPDLDGDEFLGSGPFGPPFTQADFDRLAALGANYVNISGPGLFNWEPPYGIDEQAVAHMDNLLAMIAKADMFAVITARSGPGRSPFAITRWVEEENPELLVENIWEDEAAQQAYADMWRWTAERYRDNPIVVGYDLMCEPNSTAKFGLWEPEEFYEQYGGTTHDWNTFHPLITAAIREVDPKTPILVSAEGWGGVLWLPYLETTGDPRTVYMVHQYEPQDQYTHQELPALNSYPGNFDLDYDGSPDTFDRNWLDDFLKIIDQYRQEHSVPVAVNEFGVYRFSPGAAEFMTDEMNLFDARGLNHALWSWDPAWEYWTEEVNEFIFRFGPDPKNISDVPSNDLMDAIIANWSRNTVRPSNWAAETETDEPRPGESSIPALDDVRNWLYLIDVDLEMETVDQIVSSKHDMVVLDFIPSEANNTDYPMAEVVARLHNSAHPILVLAYIDIGQAEDFRAYWLPGWGIGNPEWIVGGDPDGWVGNYPVAYWHPDWQAIVFEMMDVVLAAGFDGAYLDRVDVYEEFED